MPNKSKFSLSEEFKINHNILTTNITYTVLFTFILFLILLLIKSWVSYNITKEGNIGEVWLELFRDGFLALSGILTTLIGYYFGNKGSDATLKQAEVIKQENQKLLEDLKSLSPTIESQNAAIKPID